MPEVEKSQKVEKFPIVCVIFCFFVRDKTPLHLKKGHKNSV
jgi:hypothetical protein